MRGGRGDRPRDFRSGGGYRDRDDRADFGRGPEMERGFRGMSRERRGPDMDRGGRGGDYHPRDRGEPRGYDRRDMGGFGGRRDFNRGPPRDFGGRDDRDRDDRDERRGSYGRGPPMDDRMGGPRESGYGGGRNQKMLREGPNFKRKGQMEKDFQQGPGRGIDGRGHSRDAYDNNY